MSDNFGALDLLWVDECKKGRLEKSAPSSTGFMEILRQKICTARKERSKS